MELGEFYRVGRTKKLHIDTRVISATNKDIDQMINDGQFRRDLYFRLGVIKVKAPSLNERPDDIIPLTKHFLHEFSRKFGKKFTGISAEAESVLMVHNWTGHVRELKNLIEGAVLIGKGPELSLKGLDLDPKSQREQKTLVSEKFFLKISDRQQRWPRPLPEANLIPPALLVVADWVQSKNSICLSLPCFLLDERHP